MYYLWSYSVKIFHFLSRIFSEIKKIEANKFLHLLASITSLNRISPLEDPPALCRN
jgi:hypothetical protein